MLIQAAHQRQILRRLSPWLVIPTRPRDPEQVALASDAHLGMRRLNQCPPPLRLNKPVPPFYRSQSTSTFNCPICW